MSFTHSLLRCDDRGGHHSCESLSIQNSPYYERRVEFYERRFYAVDYLSQRKRSKMSGKYIVGSYATSPNLYALEHPPLPYNPATEKAFYEGLTANPLCGKNNPTPHSISLFPPSSNIVPLFLHNQVDWKSSSMTKVQCIALTSRPSLLNSYLQSGKLYPTESVTDNSRGRS